LGLGAAKDVTLTTARELVTKERSRLFDGVIKTGKLYPPAIQRSVLDHGQEMRPQNSPC
jgi:hypothetical protein